jgi:hypothetical protein
MLVEVLIEAGYVPLVMSFNGGARASCFLRRGETEAQA